MITLNLSLFGGQGFLNLADKTIIKNNQTWNIDISGTGANLNLRTDEISKILDRIIERGRPLTDSELLAYINETSTTSDSAKRKLARLRNAQALMINNNSDKLGFSIDPLTGEATTAEGLTAPGEGGQASAFNAYYNDLYSLAPGTGGAEMLGRLEQSYMNQAQQQAMLADVGFQQQAMQQAQTVKAITDQVRAERMARLRAGMSEAQIANQDMQSMMTNVNALNQQAQMMNQARMEAQFGMDTARDQAYMDFLGQSNQRGQVAAGMAASDAGDAYQQTLRQMQTLYGNDPSRWTPQQWQQMYTRVSGFDPNASNK
jgi:hypothetical protein